MYFNTDPTARPVRSLPLYQTLLCVVCVLILVINGISLVRNLGDLKAANARQAQADRVTAKLQYLNLLVLDAESGMRGYFLSGSDTYLGPLRTAQRELDGQFGTLKTLLADSPSQLKNLQQLQTLVTRRVHLMTEALEVYRHAGLDDILAIARTQDDRARMDEIRLQVVIMTGEQNELQASRGTAFYEQYRRTALLGLGINVAALAVLVLFYQLIRRGFRMRRLAERALQDNNEHLESLVAARTEQLQVLSRHLIRVAEEEKARLARELHDEMGANLTAIGMHLAAVGTQLASSHPEQAEQLSRARATLVETVEMKRRIVEDLRPSLLDNLGLGPALESYCEDFGRTTGIDCEALIDDAAAACAGPMQSIALFRIMQESLNNVAKYARARHVVVNLAREGEALTLEICDDGIGIPPDAMRRPKSHGLLGMRERALLLGGSLQVERGVNGNGTSVNACIPLVTPGAAGSVSADAGAMPAQGRLGMKSGGMGYGGAEAHGVELAREMLRLSAQAPLSALGGGVVARISEPHP